MRVLFLPPSHLVASPHNTKRCTDLSPLVESIRARGMLNPITATRHGVVVAGAHRLAAADSLGLPEVPVVHTPANLSDRDFHRALLAEEFTRGFTSRPDLRVDEFTPVDDLHPWWGVGQVVGQVNLSRLAQKEREAFRVATPAADKGHIAGAVQVAPDGRVVDGWWWAIRSAVRGQPTLVRVTDTPVDVAQAAEWDPDRMGTHPAHSRWAMPRQHRRISPLWRRIINEGTPGRVVDLGSGFGWHISEIARCITGKSDPTKRGFTGPVDPGWRIVGFEPYRRAAGTGGRINKPKVREQIRHVAHEATQGGPFDHAVLDHVLFLTGSDDLAHAAVGAAAALLADHGTLWVSNQHTPIANSVATRLPDGRHVGSHGEDRYLFRTWSTDEMTGLLAEHFTDVTSVAANASRLFRAVGPRTRDLTAVATEFNLEWPDGTRPGVVDELLDAMAGWPTREEVTV